MLRLLIILVPIIVTITFKMILLALFFLFCQNEALLILWNRFFSLQIFTEVICYRFGMLGGFQILLERFQSGKNLTVSVIYALIRPFGLCFEFLTVHTIVKYLMPIVVSSNFVFIICEKCFKYKILKIVMLFFSPPSGNGASDIR